METLPLALLGLSVTGVALLLAAALRLLRGRGVARPQLPYIRRGPLLTEGELRFYRALLQAMPPGLAVFVKVRLLDLVAVADRHWARYGAPASGMHLDFVLADACSAEPWLAVELDDRSHRRPEARRRDALKDAALGAAGIPLLRVPAAARYDAAELRGRIKRAGA
jgi:hypothetical protein